MQFSPEELQRFEKLYNSTNPRVSQVKAATPKKKGRGGFLTSLISEGLATAGGLGGFALGGPAGAAAGAGLLGGVGSALEQKVRDDKVNVGKAVGEGALEGVFAGGPLRLLRAGKIAASGGKLFAKEGIEEVAKKGLVGRTKSWVSDKATKSMLRATPSATTKAASAGHNLTALGEKWLPKLGSTYDEIIGKAGVKDKGNIGKLIAAEEDIIKANAKVAGSNIRIGKDEVIAALKKQASSIRGELGGGKKSVALDRLIKEAEKKYEKGVSVKEALKTLRKGNKRWGAAVVDDTNTAVLTAAQKIEVNTMRSVLKKNIPEIAGALDNQSELMTLRAVLESAAGKARSKGLQQLPQGIVKLVGDVAGSQAVSGRVAAKGLSEGVEEGAEELAKKGGRAGLLNMIARVEAGSAVNNLNQMTQVQELPGEGVIPDDLAGTEDLMGEEIGGEMGTQDQPEVIKKALLAAMIADMSAGGKNVGSLSTIYKLLGEKESTTQQAGKAAAAESVINKLEGVFQQAGGARGPIAGRGTLLGAVAGGGNQTAKSYQELRSAYTAQISRALGEVGVLTDQDRIVIQQAIPSINDSTESAAIKIKVLRDTLSDIKSRKSGTTSSSGSMNIEDLVGAFGS